MKYDGDLPMDDKANYYLGNKAIFEKVLDGMLYAVFFSHRSGWNTII